MADTAEFPSAGLRQKHAQQLQKTEMCKFFLSNRCGKGSNCSFAHSLTEIRDKPNLNKTSMCRAFLHTGNCDRPGCTFAHDERELRTTSGFFKTKFCRFATSGRCKHGRACRFAHNQSELSAEAMMRQSIDEAATLPPPPPGSYLNNGFLSDGITPCSGGQGPEAWSDLTSDPSNRDTSSDQSTRAERSASVPTPEGSGDSGQEESSRSSALGAQRRDGAPARGLRNGGDLPQGRHCTTLMLTNVPNFLTQGALVSLLEDLTVCVRGAFDFFYCPWDPYQDVNLGYLIINFFSRSVAAEFQREWANQPLLPSGRGTKRLRIVPAALQGRAANLRHFSGFSLAHHKDPRFRPLVRAGPNEALRPMAIPEELVRGGGNENAQGQTQQQQGGAGNQTPERADRDNFGGHQEAAHGSQRVPRGQRGAHGGQNGHHGGSNNAGCFASSLNALQYKEPAEQQAPTVPFQGPDFAAASSSDEMFLQLQMIAASGAGTFGLQAPASGLPTEASFMHSMQPTTHRRGAKRGGGRQGHGASGAGHGGQGASLQDQGVAASGQNQQGQAQNQQQQQQQLYYNPTTQALWNNAMLRAGITNGPFMMVPQQGHTGSSMGDASEGTAKTPNSPMREAPTVQPFWTVLPQTSQNPAGPGMASAESGFYAGARPTGFPLTHVSPLTPYLEQDQPYSD